MRRLSSTAEPDTEDSVSSRWPALFAMLRQGNHAADDDAEFVLTRRQRVIGVLLEAGAAIVVLTVLLAWCARIDQNPLLRTSQVSGLAKIDLRYLLIGFVVVAGTLIADRLASPLVRVWARQMACAAIAALASGLVAAGVMFALQGTPYGIMAGGSDFGWIASWIEHFKDTGSFPSHYPPLPIYLLWGIVELTGDPLAIASKPYEIVGTALYGPLAYFCWRTLLKPIWALTIGVVAMVPFIEPFKVYAQLMLVLMIPILIKFLGLIRRSDHMSRRQAVRWGLIFGLGFATLFNFYSGWFVWALPGSVIAFLVLTPWRKAADRALIMTGVTAAVFLPLSWVHMIGLLSPTGGVSDGFQYFDTRTEPAYIAMWRNDSAGGIGPVWPPLGEMGNVGVFSVLLVAGLAVALLLGWRRTPVIAAVAIIGGAWVMRFYLAGKMYQTGQVRLYPRTTAIILYLLLILIGFAIYYASQRTQQLYQTLSQSLGSSREELGLGKQVPMGLMLVPLLMLFLFMGSATVDRLMPADRPGSDAYAIWLSHVTKLPDGTCPLYGRKFACEEN